MSHSLSSRRLLESHGWLHFSVGTFRHRSPPLEAPLKDSTTSLHVMDRHPGRSKTYRTPTPRIAITLGPKFVETSALETMLQAARRWSPKQTYRAKSTELTFESSFLPYRLASGHGLHAFVFELRLDGCRAFKDTLIFGHNRTC